MRITLTRTGLLLPVCVNIVLSGLVVGQAWANPGVGPEPEAATPMRSVDPEVARIREAIGLRARGAGYNLQIINEADQIILQGEVDSESHRQAVVSAAASASSKRVRDELRIRPVQSDEQIAARLKDSVSRDHPRLASKVKIDVRDGVAYISGDLHNHREVDQLLAATLMVQGVRDVRSEVTVSGRPYPAKHWRAGR